MRQPLYLTMRGLTFWDETHSRIINFDLTDHCPIFVGFSCKNNNPINKRKVSFRLHSSQNILNFKQKLESCNFNMSLYSNINEKVKHFSETLSDAYLQCFPLMTKILSDKHFNKPWISPANYSKINKNEITIF